MRRLFNVAAAISLPICLASAILWASSYLVEIGWRFFTQDGHQSWTTDIGLVRGGIEIRQDIRPLYSFVVSHGPSFHRGSHRPFTRRTLLGFGGESYNYPWQGNQSATRRSLTAPWYPLVALTVAVQVIWFVGYRRRRLLVWRQQNGLCLRCGYDLRSAYDSCPECGTPVPGKPEVIA